MFLIDWNTLQREMQVNKILSIFLMFLLLFTSYSFSTGPIQTAEAIKTTGGGTTPCSPILCGKPMPQSVIKSFSPVIDISNKGFLEYFDFSVSGNKLYVVWNNHTYGISDGELYLRKSTNYGTNFDTKIKLTNNPGFNYPKIATTGNNVYVAWTSGYLNQNTGGFTLRRSIDGGNTFQNPISLSSTASNVDFSIVAMGNNVYLLWEDGGNKVLFRRSIDGGNKFSSPLTLSSFNTLQLREPKMVVDVSNVNNVYAVWVQEDSGHKYDNVVFAKSTDGGNTFSNLATVSSGVEHASGPDIALKGNNIYIAWTTDNLGLRETYFRRSTDSGKSFDAAIKIDDNVKSTEESAPSIAVNKDNNLIFVVWSDWSVYKNYAPQILLRKSSDGGGSFGKKFVLSSTNTITISNIPPNGENTNPKAIAAANNLFVIWRYSKMISGQGLFFFRYSDDSGTSFYNPYMINTATTKLDEFPWGIVKFSYDDNYLHFFWIGNHSHYLTYYYNNLYTRTAGPLS